jgi:hypothetical protein
VTDVKLNSSLVSAANIESDFVSLNLNGAAFIDGSKSDVLNPPELLKVNKTIKAPQLLIHEAVLNSVVNTHFKKAPLNLTLSMMNVTSTIDINSELLAPVFPAMVLLPNVRDVIITIQQTKTNVSLSSSRINFDMQMKAIVETQDLTSEVHRYPYLNTAQGNLRLN